MPRQTATQRAAAEQEAAVTEAAEQVVNLDNAEEQAIANRVAEHDNTSDRALIETLMRTQAEAAELKAELDKLKAERQLEQSVAGDAAVAEAAGVTPAKAVTFWLADPRSQLRLWNPDTQTYIRFRGGKYIATSDAEVKLIEDNLGGVAFKQDRDKAHAPHPVTGYAPLSDAAYDAHIALVTRA